MEKEEEMKYTYLKVLQGCYDGRTWDDLVMADEHNVQEYI